MMDFAEERSRSECLSESEVGEGTMLHEEVSDTLSTIVSPRE